MNFPFIKHVWSLEAILSSAYFFLFAMVPEAILYTVSNKVSNVLRNTLVYFLMKYMISCLVFELLGAVPCYINNLLIEYKESQLLPITFVNQRRNQRVEDSYHFSYLYSYFLYYIVSLDPVYTDW